MKTVSILGHIVDGKSEAKYWLEKFNSAYSNKLGLKICPGSLNVILEEKFFLLDPTFASKVIRMPKEEYGGQRDILMRPCRIFGRLAYIWRTENAEKGLIEDFDFRVVELITDVHLRSTFSLESNSEVEITMF